MLEQDLAAVVGSPRSSAAVASKEVNAGRRKNRSGACLSRHALGRRAFPDWWESRPPTSNDDCRAPAALTLPEAAHAITATLCTSGSVRARALAAAVRLASGRWSRVAA